VGVDLGPFLALSVLVIVIPGPDTAVVTKHALLGGRRSALLASVGVVGGLAVWTVAASLGVATLLRASEVAFLALRIVGALYLAWLGIELLRDRGVAAPLDAAPKERDRRSGRKALRQGLLSDLSNPKIAIFFTTFLPQFVHSHGAVFADLLALGAIFVTITLAWLVAYSLVIGHGASVLRRPRVRRVLDRITGVVLVGFGIRLVFER
jgi:RhtB (resistance to homoserine/threonine) family protein